MLKDFGFFLEDSPYLNPRISHVIHIYIHCNTFSVLVIIRLFL